MPTAKTIRSRKHIRLSYANFYVGFTPNDLFRFVLPDLVHLYDFEITNRPGYLIYGPYGGKLPTGSYVKIFYGCENVVPNMAECDWAFGVEHEDLVHHPRYMRLLWGAPLPLTKTSFDASDVLDGKRCFCNFVYSHRVPFREEFYKALSRYKRVDAPGISLNNMAAIDSGPPADWQKTKQAFLSCYKFTIAFENSSRPGYNTEKLTDPMLAGSLPIYWGDPLIEREFDARSFIHAQTYLRGWNLRMPRLPVRYEPYAPLFPRRTFRDRAFARLNRAVNNYEMKIAAFRAFDQLVEAVIAADTDDELYRSYFTVPYYRNNRAPDRSSYIARWQQIFG